MDYQSVFKRYELKFLLTRAQKQALLQQMEPYMQQDRYGHSTIRNIYFDTDDYRLIRHSLEKPVYKEKLRLRSYCRATETEPVFVELKKKYRSVVYKRREVMTQQQALSWLQGDAPCPGNTQILQEIDYFRNFYQGLRPAVFLSYDREAYYSLRGDDLRVTFDENILSRQEDICLASDIYGMALLPEDRVLMEVKTAGGIPLWLTRFLTQERIYKTSYSKYGTAYRNQLCNRNKEERNYV